MSRRSLETITWKIYFVSKFFLRLLRFSFFLRNFRNRVQRASWTLIFVLKTIIFRRFVDCFLRFWWIIVCIRQNDVSISTRQKIFFLLFCSFHFCFWEKRCSRSTFIFWNLDSRSWTCFFSQSDSRNLDDETNRQRDCFYQIDIQFWDQVLLIFFII